MIKFHLKSVLAARNMTQKELVEKTKIRQPTLSAWNMGKAQRINVEDIEAICKVLDCQPGDLFEYIPEDDKKPQA